MRGHRETQSAPPLVMLQAIAQPVALQASQSKASRLWRCSGSRALIAVAASRGEASSDAAGARGVRPAELATPLLLTPRRPRPRHGAPASNCAAACRSLGRGTRCAASGDKPAAGSASQSGTRSRSLALETMERHLGTAGGCRRVEPSSVRPEVQLRWPLHQVVARLSSTRLVLVRRQASLPEVAAAQWVAALALTRLAASAQCTW